MEQPDTNDPVASPHADADGAPPTPRTDADAPLAADVPATDAPPAAQGSVDDVFEPDSMRANGPTGSSPAIGSLNLLHDVDMEVTVELGRTTMPIRELLALQPGMVVEIDRAAGAPIDVLVNGRLIACGEVVVIDEEFGIRITEIVAAGTQR